MKTTRHRILRRRLLADSFPFAEFTDTSLAFRAKGFRGLLSKITSSAGFALLEASFGMGLLAIVVIALGAGINCGISGIRLAREDLRATQVMLEKMETIRLYTWEQLTVQTNFLPTNFQATYFPAGSSKGACGTVYNGTVTLKPLALSANYNDDIAVMTVEVEWTTVGLKRRRTLSTYISQYGLQNYLW